MSSQERLHALDAVRAFALLAGIVLHATMSFFLPIPAHDVSQSATLGVLFFVIHTFRMTTFFVVAGLFARLLLERRGTRGFVRDRAKRILGPMLVGWVVLAPLTIGALIWGVGRSADPAVRDAMTAAAANAGPGAFPLVHLWFLYYLTIFYVLVLAVRGLVMNIDRAGILSGVLDKGVRVLLRSYVAPIVLAAPIFAVLGFDQRILLLGGIPTPDSSLIPQLPALVGFGTAFGLGWLVHRQLDVLGEWRKRWLGHLAIGAALSVICLTVPGVKNGTTAAWLFDSAEWSRTVYAACYLVSIWYWGFGIIGAALKFCASESPVRRYLADSSYWLYLAHLPIVFFLQAALALVPLHWAIKFPLILAISLTVLLASYHYLVRPTWLGEILNGRKYPRSKRTPGGDPSSPQRGPTRRLPSQGVASGAPLASSAPGSLPTATQSAATESPAADSAAPHRLARAG